VIRARLYGKRPPANIEFYCEDTVARLWLVPTVDDSMIYYMGSTSLRINTLGAYVSDAITLHSYVDTSNYTSLEMGNTLALIDVRVSGTSYKSQFDNTAVFPATDAQLDIGKAAQRWKDLYLSGSIVSGGGMISAVARITGNTTLGGSHHHVFCDTDGGAFNVTLPAGTAGRTYRLVNVGSSGNDVTIIPDGAELLRGINANAVLIDSSEVTLVYETTEGWW